MQQNLMNQFGSVLQATAPLLENAQAHLRQDEDIWILAVKDDVNLEFYINEYLYKAVLCIPVEKLKLRQRATAYRMLLTMNGLWRETGGLRFSFEEPDGGMEMCLDLSPDQLDEQILAAKMKEFIELGRTWQKLLTGPMDAESTPYHDDNHNAAFLLNLR